MANLANQLHALKLLTGEAGATKTEDVTPMPAAKQSSIGRLAEVLQQPTSTWQLLVALVALFIASWNTQPVADPADPPRVMVPRETDDQAEPPTADDLEQPEWIQPTRDWPAQQPAKPATIEADQVGPMRRAWLRLKQQVGA